METNSDQQPVEADLGVTPPPTIIHEDLSFGAKAVGLSFNPSQNKDVHHQKVLYASIIDDLNNKRNQTEDPEKKRLLSIAITEAQSAQMWAVKAITW